MTREEAIEIIQDMMNVVQTVGSAYVYKHNGGYERLRGILDILRSTPQPGKPLTLDQLREMDGQPVWIVEYPDWGHWELSEDANDYIVDRNLDFYGMKHDDPDGRYGLHKLGWLAYSYPPAQQRWIPVSERLPEKGKTVLVYRKSEYVGVEESCMDRLEEIGKCTLWIGTSGWFEVTHWMPLPEPPEEG